MKCGEFIYLFIVFHVIIIFIIIVVCENLFVSTVSILIYSHE
jgi:hypothetical protein